MTHGSRVGNDRAPITVAHVIFRLDTGGLENGLVNLINRSSTLSIRHIVICMTHATAFRKRIERDDVPIVELHKKPGKGTSIYWRFWRAIRQLRPDIVHTRNVNTLELQFFAALAGVRGRIHGEHGWDVHDLHGTSRKYRWLRKLMRPFVKHFIVVSEDLGDYLESAVGVHADRVTLIRNGVDTHKFRPAGAAGGRSAVSAVNGGRALRIGAVGRLQEVKNHRLLVQAFLEVLRRRPELRDRVHVTIVGDGPLRAELIAALEKGGAAGLYSLPGESAHVEKDLRDLDIFVLPSRNEGISNTVLEAMGTGLPVVATRVGGNAEIVRDGETGLLVADDDVDDMASAILAYVDSPELRKRHGEAGLADAVERFSLERMVADYTAIYENLSRNRS